MNCKECRHWFINPNIAIPGEPTEGNCLVSEIKAQSNHVCNAWELSQIAEWKDDNEKLTARIAELKPIIDKLVEGIDSLTSGFPLEIEYIEAVEIAKDWKTG